VPLASLRTTRVIWEVKETGDMLSGVKYLRVEVSSKLECKHSDSYIHRDRSGVPILIFFLVRYDKNDVGTVQSRSYGPYYASEAAASNTRMSHFSVTSVRTMKHLGWGCRQLAIV